MSGASGENLYSFKTAYPDVLQVGRANTARMPVAQDGGAVVPDSGTFSLLRPDGTAVVDDQAVDVGSGLAVYEIPASALPDDGTLPLGEGWQEVWKLTLDGAPITVDREAALARRPLHPVTSDDDVLQLYPDLDSRAYGPAVDNLQGFRQQAHGTIIRRLITEGHLPYLVKSAWAFYDVELHLILAHFFRYVGRTKQDYLAVARQHADTAEAAWAKLNFTVDHDHNGRVDDPSKRTSGTGALHINGAPRRRLSRNPRF